MGRLSTWVRGGRSGKFEFSSQASLRHYLTEHPHADVSKHTVKAPTAPTPAGEVPRPAPRAPATSTTSGAIKGPRTWTTVPPKSLVKDTFAQHFRNGEPTPERAAKVHDPILKEALDKVPRVAPGQQKVAIMTMGGPGSGKSTALAMSPDFVHIDPDNIRAKLPEWKDATRHGATYMDASSKTHEEASHIAKQMQKQAIEQGKNVIVDGTGGNTKNFMKKMSDLQAAGYKVHVAFTHVPADEGIARAEKRAEKSGRMVPHKTATETYAALPTTLAAARKQADSLMVFDNTERGGKPKLVEHVKERRG